MVVLSYFQLNDVSSTELTDGEQLAVRTAQAAIINVRVDRIEYLGVEVEPTVGITRNSIDLDTADIVVITRLVLNMVDYPEYNRDPNVLYANITSLIEKAFNGGEFMDKLQTLADQIQSTLFQNASMQAVSFDPPKFSFPPTQSPTKSPKSQSGLKDIEVVGLVIGVVLGTLLLIFGVLYVIMQKRRRDQVLPTVDEAVNHPIQAA